MLTAASVFTHSYTVDFGTHVLFDCGDHKESHTRVLKILYLVVLGIPKAEHAG